MVKSLGIVERTIWGSAYKELSTAHARNANDVLWYLIIYDHNGNICLSPKDFYLSILYHGAGSHSPTPFDVGMAMWLDSETWDKRYLSLPHGSFKSHHVTHSMTSSCAVTHRAHADIEPLADWIPESLQWVFLLIHSGYVEWARHKLLSYETNEL